MYPPLPIETIENGTQWETEQRRHPEMPKSFVLCAKKDLPDRIYKVPCWYRGCMFCVDSLAVRMSLH